MPPAVTTGEDMISRIEHEKRADNLRLGGCLSTPVFLRNPSFNPIAPVTWGHTLKHLQGPFKIVPGEQREIPFRNIFASAMDFSFICDHPAFVVASGEMQKVPAKSTNSVTIKFLPEVKSTEVAYINTVSCCPCFGENQGIPVIYIPAPGINLAWYDIKAAYVCGNHKLR